MAVYLIFIFCALGDSLDLGADDDVFGSYERHAATQPSSRSTLSDSVA
jgi:hypothetical protein